MAAKYEKKRITQSVLMYASCDKCKNDIYVDDNQLTAGGIFRHSFSWQNPKYPCGDMIAVLCDSCVIDVFHFGQFTEDQY